MSSKDDEGENQFDRLPDDVVLHIFNRLLEAKWLCRCSIVSKRFASLIPHVHTIFAPHRHWKSHSDAPPGRLNFAKKICKFLVNDVVAKPFRFLHRLVAATKPPPPSPSGPLKFLRQFGQIQSLHFEIQPRSNDPVGCESLFKWGAKFGTKLETCTFLYPTSLHRMNENPFQSEEVQTENELGVTQIGADELKSRVFLAFACLKDALLRHALLVSLIRNHPMLRSVTITDMRNWGARLCVRGEGLAQLRELANSPELETTLRVGVEDLKSMKVRVCHLPVLHLPFSGYVMEGVTLLMIELVERNCDDDDSVLVDSFEEEEDAFGEAVAEILTNHKDKLEELADWSKDKALLVEGKTLFVDCECMPFFFYALMKGGY